MSGELRIELLADHPEAIPVLERWFRREWAPYYGRRGPGDARRDLLASCNRNEPPMALVALAGDTVCGTAALEPESITTHPHLSPWLAALLVGTEFRRRGIAGELIAAVEDKARRLGFETIHAGTGEGSGTPEGALRRRGWQLVERAPYFVSEVCIFRKAL